MKTSLYDEIIYLLEHVGTYGLYYDRTDPDPEDDEWLAQYDKRRFEALRLLKNEPKKEA